MSKRWPVILVAVVGIVFQPIQAARAGSSDGAAGALRQLWTRWGTGMVTDLAIGDLDGDGANDVLVGGRGVGAVVPTSLQDGLFRWVNKWDGSSDPPGDSDTVQEMRLADVNGDGVLDAFVGMGQQLFTMDGRTGRTLWVSHEKGFEAGAWEIATADWSGDGIQDVAYGDLIDDKVTVLDGTDGSKIWYYLREGAIIDMAAGDVDLDGATDLVVLGEVDFPSQFEIHAVSGDGIQSGRAQALWLQDFPASRGRGDPRVVAIAQVEAATPQPEVVIGGGDGFLNILDGATGSVLAYTKIRGGIADVATLNLDGDPDLEIVVADDRPSDGSDGNVYAFDQDAAPLWRLKTPGAAMDLQPADLDGNGRYDIVVGCGWQETPPAGKPEGFVLALDPGGPALRWTVELPEYAGTVAVGEVFGAATVLAGGGVDGGVWGLAPDGGQRWFFRTGDRVEEVLAADLDGAGPPEVIEGADDATVAVRDARGRLRWQHRVPGHSSPDVISMAAGDLTPGPGLDVVAGTWEFEFSGPRGRLHAFSGGGRALWTVDLVGTADAVDASDLDGDGATDVVVATSIDGSALRLDAAGRVVWQATVNTASQATLALVDVNGDGTLDPIVGSKPIVGPGEIFALNGSDGALLWHSTTAVGINWLDATGRPEDGIVAGDLAGGVYRFDAAGRPVWSVTPGLSSWDGEWSVDANGDAIRDVVSVSEDGNARMLDGRTGVVLWTTPTDGLPALTVATLRGGRPLVAMGTYPAAPIAPAGVFVLDARTGQPVGRFDTQGMVIDLAPGQLDRDRAEELLAGAGWQLHAVDVP